MKKLASCFFLFLSPALWAGQSIVLSTQSVSNGSVAAQTVGNPFRVEMSLHNVDLNFPQNENLWNVPPIGLMFGIQNVSPGDIRYFIYDANEVGGLIFSAEIGTTTLSGNQPLPNNFSIMRFNHDPSSKTDTFQVWDSSGNLFSNQQAPYTSESGVNSNGLTLSGGGTGLDIAYFRVYTSTVSSTARPPITADTTSNCLFFWKFEGNLTDSCSAGPYNGTISAGVDYYAQTPYQALVTSLIQTNPAPLWGPIQSWRAGYPGTLDATASYSQSDSGGPLAYQWQFLTSPSPGIWSSHTSAGPTITGLTYGDYYTQLTVKDTSSLVVGVSTAHVGAVSADTNGVVISSDANVDRIFGPMIAWGKNPWGYMDERSKRGSDLNEYGSPTQFWTWLTRGVGVSSWTWGGIGSGVGPVGTTLTTGISSSSQTLIVADKTRFDFSEFPTRVLVFGSGGPEEVRICSKTDGSGNTTTLNVCYDGRNSGAYAYTPQTNPGNTAISALSGTIVGQHKVLGTNTLFLTDPNTAICPSGAAGIAGTIYSSGTATMLISSNVMVGVGWTSAIVGKYVRVDATHASGTPFVFLTTVSSIISSTQAVLSRVYPSDADNGTFVFKILNLDRMASLEYTRVDGSTGRRLFGTTGCESETGLYGYWQFDGGVSYNGVSFNNQKYSYKTGTGNQSDFGRNFYGSGIAHRAIGLRSGLADPMRRGNVMDDYWCSDPEEDGHGFGENLQWGGGAWGCTIDLITNPNTAMSWPDVRGFALHGYNDALGGCNTEDSRDTGYSFGVMTLAYLYDPDTSSSNAPGGISWHQYWKNGIQNMISRDTSTLNAVTGELGCKNNDNSWANGLYFNSAGPAVDVTAGTTTVVAHSGSSFNSSNTCFDIAHGSASVTNGSSHITGTGFPAATLNGQIILTGVKSGAPFTLWTAYTQFSSTAANITGKWQGDTSSASWIIRDGSTLFGMATIANSNDDPLIKKNWACFYQDSTHIQLHKPWNGSTDVSGSLHLFDSSADAGIGLAGYGQQPFMLGIKMRSMLWLATNPASEFQSTYKVLLSSASLWMHDVGISSDTWAINYGRIFDACEPDPGLGANTGQYYRNGGNCMTGPDTFVAWPDQRQLNNEGMTAVYGYYLTPSVADALSWGDHVYGASFGYPAWTTGGVFTDGIYANESTANMGDVSLAGYKYFGQAFGVGMTHTWPALRLGGFSSVISRTLQVGFNLASVSNAAKVRVSLTEPSGYVVQNICTTSPCAVTGDVRQGSHLIKLEYLSSGNVVLAAGDQQIQGVQ